MSSELAVIFQDVQYSTHLRENEHSGSFGLHRFEQFVENDHFTRILDEMLVGREWSSGLGSVEHCDGSAYTLVDGGFSR